MGTVGIKRRIWNTGGHFYMTLLLAHHPLGVSAFHTVALFEALVELCVSVKSVVHSFLFLGYELLKMSSSICLPVFC